MAAVKQTLHLPAFIAAVALGLTPFVTAGDAPLLRSEVTAEQLQPTTAYYSIYMLGKKVGWSSEHFSRGLFEGQDAYIAQMIFHEEVLNDGEPLKMLSADTEYFSVDPPYRMIAASSITEQKRFKTSIWIRPSEPGSDEFVAHLTGGKAERTKELGKLDLTLGDSLAIDAWCRSEPKVGEAVRIRELDFTDLEVRPALNTMKRILPSHGEGAVEALGHIAKYEFDYMDAPSKTQATFTTDKTGRLVRGKISGVVKLKLTTEAEAKRLEATLDLFDSSLIKIDKPLGDPTKIREMVLEISGPGAKAVADGPFQNAEQQESGKIILKIGRQHGAKIPVTVKDRAKALEETSVYPTKDPQVITLAQSAIGKATREKAKIKRLVDFVDRFIIDDYGNEPLSVNDIIDTQRGDCSEHSQLFVTLARSIGIPAREVGGFIYGEDTEYSFGGHAWCEVEVDGHWHPVDPTWGETVINATHIRISGERASSEELGLYLGNLKFRVLSTTDKKGRVRKF